MGILEPIFTAWILASVVAKDLGSFYMAIAVFAGAKIFQQIVGFVMEFSKSRSINGIEVHIEAKFFQKFIFFENTHAEKYGTGKIISLSTK